MPSNYHMILPSIFQESDFIKMLTLYWFSTYEVIQESPTAHCEHSWEDYWCTTPLPVRHIHHPSDPQSHHNCERCKPNALNLLRLLPSGMRYRSLHSHTARLTNSFLWDFWTPSPPLPTLSPSQQSQQTAWIPPKSNHWPTELIYTMQPTHTCYYFLSLLLVALLLL